MDLLWVQRVKGALRQRGLRYDDAIGRLRRSDAYMLAYTEFTQGDMPTADRLLSETIETIWPRGDSDAVGNRSRPRRIQGPQRGHGQDVQQGPDEPEGG